MSILSSPYLPCYELLLCDEECSVLFQSIQQKHAGHPRHYFGTPRTIMQKNETNSNTTAFAVHMLGAVLGVVNNQLKSFLIQSIDKIGIYT